MYIALILIFILSVYWRGLNNVNVIFSLPVLITVVVGHLGFITFSFAYDLPFQLGDNLQLESYIMAENLLIVSVLFFVLGGSFFSPSKTEIKRSEISFSKFEVNKFLLFLFSIIPALMLFQAYGWGEVLYRTEYIPKNINYLKSVGSILAVVVLFILPNTTMNRLSIFFIYCLYFFLFFSYASRFMAVVFLVYVFSNLIFKNEKLISVKIFLPIFLCLLSVLLAIQMRRTDEHGFIPYVTNILSKGIDMDLLRISLNYITSYSYSLTAYLIERDFNTEQLFWKSISPIPGSIIGWSEVSNQLRVNVYVPFNAFFELYKKGYPYLISYFFFSGLIFSFIEKTIKGKSLVFYLLFLILVMLFVITSLQYNLRSSTRLIYYSLVVLFSFYLFEFFKFLAAKVKR